MTMTAVAPTYSDETGHDLFAGYLETLALIERLHRFVVSRMETIAEYQDFFTIGYQERPFLGTSTFSSIARSAEVYRAGVRRLIEDCKNDGTLDRNTDTHLLMLAIDGMTGWAYVWFRGDGSQNPTDIGETFWSFLISGTGTTDAASASGAV